MRAIVAKVAPLLRIRHLTVEYQSGSRFLTRKPRRVRALNDVNLDVYPREILGVVGESGCGKTTLGRTLMRLERPSAGEIVFEGTDLLGPDRIALSVRTREMQMLFQNPTSSLNPRMRVRDLIAEPLVTHTSLRGEALTARVQELMLLVGMESAYLDRFPHALSGGQAQRVAIARALALDPRFLVLDEPTSALDVSVQAQIVNLLKELQAHKGFTYLFISHDLAVVQHISHRTAVMYLGAIVEQAPSATIFNVARHPYTRALLSATPRPDPASGRQRIVLKGSVPDPAAMPEGCPFHPRCAEARQVCHKVKPALVQVEEGHWVACHPRLPNEE
jgi:oligopeptide/dipeptide ABC transporter ATP-binding protein